MLKNILVLLLSFFLSLKSVRTNNMTLILEVGPKRLYTFNGVGDQIIFHWPAHLSNNRYLVQFSGAVNQTGSGVSVKCEPRNVTIFIRKDAIPLPNPRNAFIPKNTYVLDDGYLFNGSFVLSSEAQNQNTDVYFTASSADVSNFFVSLFLPYDSERFEVSGLSKECNYYSTIKVFITNLSDKIPIASESQNDGIQLSRHQRALFDIQYLPQNYNFNLSTNENVFLYWNVFSLTDSGGTLDITLHLSSFVANTSTSKGSVNATVHGCVMRKTTSNKQSNLLNCVGTEIQLSSSNKNNPITWHFPFPASGTWTLNLSLQCTDLNSLNSACAKGFLPGRLSVSIVSCIDDCNSDMKHGSCGVYRSDAILFSACRCKVDWMGLACNDGRNALSYYTQLLHTLLLTLSNLMFIPCIVLAIYRHFYTEALVYFFVLFMSSFYHACDQPGQAVYCLLPYDTLQFSDFLSSITAIWFTLIALAKLPHPFESFLHVLGLISLAVCVSYNRFNIWTTIVPAVVGVLIVLSKWTFKYHKLKKCYPGRKKTLFSIVPGVICAGVGMSLYAFLETSENYYIVHSIWHILMASAVLFLLPIGPKRKKSKTEVYADNVAIYSSRNPLSYGDYNLEPSL